MKKATLLYILFILALMSSSVQAQGIVDFGRVEVGHDSIIQVGYLSTLPNSIAIDNPHPPFYLISYARDTTGGWNYLFQFRFQPDHSGEYSVTPVRTYDANGNLLCSLILQGEGMSVNDVSESTILHPSSFSLSAFPNPFNPTTTLSFTLPQAGEVNLRVFDILGREVAVLKDGFLEAGAQHITFDGSDLTSGVYFVRFVTPKQTVTQKILLLK